MTDRLKSTEIKKGIRAGETLRRNLSERKLRKGGDCTAMKVARKFRIFASVRRSGKKEVESRC
jgi:hypothetical protein